MKTSLTVFKLELARVYDRNHCLKCSNGHNSFQRQKKTELPFLCSAHHLMVLYISVNYYENISNNLTYKADMILWQMDGQTDHGKNKMPLNLKEGVGGGGGGT